MTLCTILFNFLFYFIFIFDKIYSPGPKTKSNKIVVYNKLNGYNKIQLVQTSKFKNKISWMIKLSQSQHYSLRKTPFVCQNRKF